MPFIPLLLKLAPMIMAMGQKKQQADRAAQFAQPMGQPATTLQPPMMQGRGY